MERPRLFAAADSDLRDLCSQSMGRQRRNGLLQGLQRNGAKTKTRCGVCCQHRIHDLPHAALTTADENGIGRGQPRQCGGGAALGQIQNGYCKLCADMTDQRTSLRVTFHGTDPAGRSRQRHLNADTAGSRADIVHTRSCKVRSQNGALKLRILLDKNSVEVFVNDGEQTMTAWIYTPQSADGITFAADGKATITAEQFELNL